MMPNAEKSQVSLRLPAELVSRFDQIARVLDRDRTWVMQRALTEYLDQEGAALLEDAEGLAELDRGESVDFDEMLDKAEAVVQAAEARRTARFG